jgi:hypothetical protein
MGELTMKYVLMMNHRPDEGAEPESWTPEDVEASWKHMQQI